MSEKHFAVGWSPKGSSRSEHYLQYAFVYKATVKVLLQEINLESKYWYHDYYILPLLATFRHFVELQLKGLILFNNEKFNTKNVKHDLVKSVKRLKKEDKNVVLSKDCEEFIGRLNDLDKDSQAFRYPERRYMEKIFNDNKTLKLSEIIIMIKKIMKELENIEGGYDYKEEQLQESLRNQ